MCHLSLCRTLAAAVLSVSLFSALPATAAELHVYNWTDYIAPDTVAQFEKETGVKVVYEMFDSNEVLEKKLLAGQSGFDVVVPSIAFLGRQIKAGIFLPLDKTKLSNYRHLDRELLQKLRFLDPKNEHAVPYLWGTTGIGYNPKLIKERLGEDAPLDSWSLFFNPENLAKLADCGVSVLDAPSDVLAMTLFYLGKNPNSLDPKDYTDIAKPYLSQLRPYIKKFDSSEYVEALANGSLCLAVGWSGDILQASARAEEAGKGVEVVYSLPKEGSAVWFDMLAIPKDSDNVEAAYQFINYLLRPDVIANISNYVAYANANKDALSLTDKTVRNNPSVYPSQAVKDKLYTLTPLPLKIDRVITSTWFKVKTGL